MDCGPTCLRMIAKFYGKNYSLQTLRTKCHITREGVSMLGISDAAELIGFRTEGVKLTWEQLRDNIPFPLIVHWKQRHFVVVYNIKKNRQSSQKDDYWVYVADPAGGLLKYNKEDFRKCRYSTREDNVTVGTALIIEPSPRLYEEKGDSTKRSILRIGYMMK